jgi:hypothetical protein
MFRFNKTIIREPTVCVSLKSQYWRQLKYFVIELSGRVAAYLFVYRAPCRGETLSQSAWCIGHTTGQFNNEVF